MTALNAVLKHFGIIIRTEILEPRIFIEIDVGDAVVQQGIRRLFNVITDHQTVDLLPDNPGQLVCLPDQFQRHRMNPAVAVFNVNKNIVPLGFVDLRLRRVHLFADRLARTVAQTHPAHLAGGVDLDLTVDHRHGVKRALSDAQTAARTFFRINH